MCVSQVVRYLDCQEELACMEELDRTWVGRAAWGGWQREATPPQWDLDWWTAGLGQRALGGLACVGQFRELGSWRGSGCGWCEDWGRL